MKVGIKVMEEEMDLAANESIEDFEPKYLGQLQLELTALETEEKINQHQQRKIKALITMIKNRK